MSMLVFRMDIGSPREYLKFYHYLFMDYSPVIAQEILTKHNMELNSKNDKAFIDGVYKLMRDMFDYVPKLTRDHFFSTGYSQVKANMTCEIIAHIQSKLKSQQASNSCLASVSSSYSSLPRNIKTSVSNTSIDTSLVKSQVVTPNKSLHSHRAPTRTNSARLCQQNNSKSPPATAQVDLTAVTKALENVFLKVDTLNNRLTSFEDKVNPEPPMPVKEEPIDSVTISKTQFQELMTRLASLEKQNDNFRSRITILETQYLVTQSSKPSHRESMDNMADKTVFHSFIDTTNIDDDDDDDENRDENADSLVEINDDTGRSEVVQSLLTTPANKAMYGGLGKGGLGMYQGMPVEYEKNDLTPTNSSITPKFESSQIMRAKDLVCR